MRKLLTLIASVAVLAATPAFADPRVEPALLPDGSQIVFVTNSHTRIFGPSTAQSATLLCNPNCAPVEENAASSSGVLGIVANPLGAIGAAAVFGQNLPVNVGDNTTVTQSGGGANANASGGSAQQVQVQGQLAEGGSSTNVNTPIAQGGAGGGVVNNNGNGNCTTGLGVGGCGN